MSDYAEPLVLVGRHLQALEDAAALRNYGMALVYLTEAQRSLEEVQNALAVLQAKEEKSGAARD